MIGNVSENIDHKITVLLCTYNRIDMLPRALGSLFNQTLSGENFEILIIDDGSTDGTSDHVNSILKTKNHNIRFYKFPKNYGLGTGRCIGIYLARYPWITFMDDDCIADKNWLEEYKNFIANNPGIVAVEGRTSCNYSELRPLTHLSLNEKGGLYWGCNVLFRRDAAISVGNYDENYRLFCEDVDFAWRLKAKGAYPFCNGALMIHPPRPEKLLSVVKKMHYYEGFFRLYRKLPEEFKAFAKATPWPLLYKKIFVWTAYNELKKWFSYGLKEPGVYIKLILAITLQRLYLLALMPRFIKAAKGARALTPFDPKIDYTRETVEHVRKLYEKIFGEKAL